MGQSQTSGYTTLSGIETWWDVTGEGEPLVLLHPGGADSRAWDVNLPGLAERFRVYRYDRRGQGRTHDDGGPLTFARMTADAAEFLTTIVGGPAHLYGHSVGAPVGLLVAQQHPDLVRKLVFSEGVFHHDGWLPGVLDPLPPEVDEFLGGLHGEVSPGGSAHWHSVWQRLDDEHHREPALTADDLAGIPAPTLLMFADGDSEVVPKHVHTMRLALPHAQLAIVPAASHGLPVDRPELSNLLVTKFLLGEP